MPFLTNLVGHEQKKVENPWFKPFTDSASLLVYIEKKTFFVFGGGFLEVTSQ